MAQPKVILQLYPMLPAANEKARRLLGRDRDLYHCVVHERVDNIKAAEDVGAPRPLSIICIPKGR
jgi:hypothetical protein